MNLCQRDKPSFARIISAGCNRSRNHEGLLFSIYRCLDKEDQKDMKQGRGRLSFHSGKRPDISVWNKSSMTIRAIIEIKKASSLAPVSADAEKIMRLLKLNQSAKLGYVLVYSEAKAKGELERKQRLLARFDEWTQKLSSYGWKIAGHRIGTKGDDEWAWGVLLLRYQSRAQ